MMKIGRLSRAPFFMADFFSAASACCSRLWKALIQKRIVVAAEREKKPGLPTRHENIPQISHLRK
jgi:hypothetical protein